MESILEIKDNYKEDDSIKSLETFAYQPISGTQLNDAGQITIRIENQDAYFYPRRSWLQIEGQLVKADGTAFIDNDMISLVNNGLMYLFDNIKYHLSGQEIESLYHPGYATTILGLAKYPKDFASSLNQCWKLDISTASTDANTGFRARHDYIIEKSAPKGSFRFIIDLEHIFGFCEDYDKVMYGFVHSLILVRGANSNNALFRAAGEGTVDGKIDIKKISWMMPRLEPSDQKRYLLYKSIEKKETLSVGFRMRQCVSVALQETPTFTWRLGVRSIPDKPRFMLIALQTGKANAQLQNSALFDHCSLTNMYVLLNNVRYPAIDFNADFAKNHYENLYKNLADFRQKYYGIDSLVSNIDVDPVTYKELFPIFVFDLSKQSERLQQGVVDITVEMMFNGNVAPHTVAYAMLISDRKLKFQSDGKKMNVIF